MTARGGAQGFDFFDFSSPGGPTEQGVPRATPHCAPRDYSDVRAHSCLRAFALAVFSGPGLFLRHLHRSRPRFAQSFAQIPRGLP